MESTTLPAQTATIPTTKAEKKCVILGTAQTWRLAPFGDPSYDILALNDGYVLGIRAGHPNGLPRQTHHFDLHPISQMSFHPAGKTRVNASEVPTGAYLRPEGHLAWLKSRPFPVFVNEVPNGWGGNVRRFPREQIEKAFGTNYFTSTPAWMVAWAILEGYTTIAVYGVHLATEWEYVSQRPNFEWWLSMAMGRGIVIELPAKCPLLKSKHVYAYEPKPDLPLQAIQTQIAQTKHEGAQLQKMLAALPWYARGRKADLVARLDVVNLELADAKQAQHRLTTVLHA